MLTKNVGYLIFLLSLTSTAVAANGATNDSAHSEWETFKQAHIAMASDPDGMYALQDTDVIGPDESRYLPQKRGLDAIRWQADEIERPLVAVSSRGERVTVRGIGFQEVDLLKQPKQQLRLPNGLIVGVSRYYSSAKKLWLYNPALINKRGFVSLSFFPYDPKGVVEGTFVRKSKPVPVNHLDSQRHAGLMYWVGDMQATIAGRPRSLRAYNYGNDLAKMDYLLLLIRDGTSGKSSYSAGRVLELHFEKGALPKHARLDFNMLYALLCAHSDFYNCPVNLTDKLDAQLAFGERYPPLLSATHGGSPSEAPLVPAKRQPTQRRR